MKISLWKDIVRYGKTKGRAPLDERQMDVLKEQYVELAKSVILGFLVFGIFYGYMDLYGRDISFSFLSTSMSLIGIITYYYLLRFAYLQIIGIDVNFEVLLVPAFLGVPFLFTNSLASIGIFIEAPVLYFRLAVCTWPLWLLFVYWGANRIYQKGHIAMEQIIQKGEQHFRNRKQIVNFGIVAIILLCVLPIPYDYFLSILFIAGACFTIITIWYYGFHTPKNTYILNEEGLRYHKALWNQKGGIVSYDQIASVKQQDTFNIGYSKDKVLIQLKNGEEILLFPENAYRFCVELEQMIQ